MTTLDSTKDLSVTNLERMIHLIYQTIDDATLWDKFLADLCSVVGAKYLHLVAHDKSNGALSFSATTNMPPEGELDFLHKYQFIDPRVHHVLPKPELEWVRDHEIISEETMAVHPFYQEFMIPWGVKYLSVCKLVDNAQALVLFGAITSPEQGPLSQESMDFLSRLIPHIKRVCELSIQQFTYSTQALVGHTLVNKLRQPVILASLNGEVIHINESAEQLLKSTALISVKNGQLILPAKYSQPFFDDCVAMEYKLKGNEAAANPTEFKLLQLSEKNQNQTLYAFYSLMLPQRLSGAFGLRPLVMLFFYHPESAPQIDTSILTAAFGFTPAECRTAILLADGLTQKEIANRLGVKYDTIRKQLQAMYQKTATKQQSELIRLMLHLPSNFVQEPVNKLQP